MAYYFIEDYESLSSEQLSEEYRKILNLLKEADDKSSAALAEYKKLNPLAREHYKEYQMWAQDAKENREKIEAIEKLVLNSFANATPEEK